MNAARDPILAALRQQGLKLTPQRLAIVAALVERDGHPTVHDIYVAVRPAFPTMSLATVYNTLHTLARAGVVAELPFATGTRFDRVTTPHVNLVCQRCGDIVDAHEYGAILDCLREAVTARSDFVVSTHRLDFYGFCARCAARPREGWASPSRRASAAAEEPPGPSSVPGADTLPV
jgi:Fur family transcriptional regulator, peroxide stress response regulator